MRLNTIKSTRKNNALRAFIYKASRASKKVVSKKGQKNQVFCIEFCALIWLVDGRKVVINKRKITALKGNKWTT